MRLAHIFSQYSAVNHVFVLRAICLLRRFGFEIHVFSSGHRFLQDCESKWPPPQVSLPLRASEKPCRFYGTTQTFVQLAHQDEIAVRRDARSHGCCGLVQLGVVILAHDHSRAH